MVGKGESLKSFKQFINELVLNLYRSRSISVVNLFDLTL